MYHIDETIACSDFLFVCFLMEHNVRHQRLQTGYNSSESYSINKEVLEQLCCFFFQ